MSTLRPTYSFDGLHRHLALIDEATKADPRLKGVLLAQLAKLAAMTIV